MSSEPLGGDFHSTSDALLVGWIGMVASAVHGIALTVTALFSWRRTRPACRVTADTERSSVARTFTPGGRAERVVGSMR
ncbi:hypothetical protein [Streptomyces sp. NPDC047434]|uniref:hypothetical protein n=1 Tax=Streptomyces sp. NPDC047434 TaxID=3155143 RepID=UPI0034068CCA